LLAATVAARVARDRAGFRLGGKVVLRGRVAGLVAGVGRC
jgi:hypothetical protein